MSPTQGAPWPEPRTQTAETQRRVVLTAEPSAEGGEGGLATQPRPRPHPPVPGSPHLSFPWFPVSSLWPSLTSQSGRASSPAFSLMVSLVYSPWWRRLPFGGMYSSRWNVSVVVTAHLCYVLQSTLPVFKWKIFFQPFTYSLYVSPVLRWVSCRQHT